MLNKILKLKNKEYIKNIRKDDSVLVDGDFVKTYKTKDKNLKVHSTNKSIELELLSPYHQMLPVGKSVKIAEIKLKDWNNKNNLFNELEFFDRKNFKKKDKQFIYKYCEEKTITMKLPAELPEQAKDNEMFKKVVGDWDNATEFTKLSELPHKDIRVGIFTETILGEKMEWLPTIDGFDIFEWAAYDITELDSLEHDTSWGYFNSLIMIDTTHFILAYMGSGYHGYIKTFSIDSNYNITQIDVLEHDTVRGFYNSLVMIDTTHFILAYRGTDDDGFIKTFSIDGSYNITQIDSLEHDTVYGAYNSLVMIDTTHFILAYSGTDDDGFIKTFSIDGSYNITQIDVLEHDTVLGHLNSLVMIDTTHFILAYQGANNDGFIKTFSIDGSYNITQIDVLEHDIVESFGNSLVMIDTTHFIFAYNSNIDTTIGYIKTFSIDSNYNITQIDVLEHDTVRGFYSSLVMIDTTHFILAYSGTDDDGFIKTFSIDGSYNITQIDVLEHDTVLGAYSSLVMIDTTHFILAYAGAASDGFIKTFYVEPNIPIVTTQACTAIQQTTATGNGNITDTGGENATRRGFCYMTGTSGDPTTANSVAYDDGNFGTGAYTKGITGLAENTEYRIRAYVTNSAGTGYGTTVQITTLRDNFTNPTNAYTEDGVFATTPATNGKVYVSLSKDGGTTYTPELLQTFNGTNAYLTYGDGDTELWGDSFNGDEINDTNFRLKIKCETPETAYQIYKNFGFSISSNRILTGIEVKVKAKWVTDTTSIDHIAIKIYYGTSALPIQTGSQVFASDGRKNGEGAGNGSGVLVFYDGSDWMACDSGVIVAA